MPVFKKYIPQSPSRRQTLRFNLCLKFNHLFHVQGKQYEKTALYSLNAILVEDVHKKGHRSSPLPPSQAKPSRKPLVCMVDGRRGWLWTIQQILPPIVNANKGREETGRRESKRFNSLGYEGVCTLSQSKSTLRDITWNEAGKTWYYAEYSCSIRFSSIHFMLYRGNLDCFSNSACVHFFFSSCSDSVRRSRCFETADQRQSKCHALMALMRLGIV